MQEESDSDTLVVLVLLIFYLLLFDYFLALNTRSSYGI